MEAFALRLPIGASFVAASLIALSALVGACSPRPGASNSATPGAPAPAIAAPHTLVTKLDPAIWYVFQDSRGAYWFSSNGNGLYRWDGSGHTLQHFTVDSGLCHNQVRRIQEDRSGNLIIATSGGISKFDGSCFTTLTVDESQPAVTEWKLGPDDLWLGGGGEDPHVIFYDGTSLRRLRMPTTADALAFEAQWPKSKYPWRNYGPYDVYTTYKDRRGNVWIGTANLGVCRFDGKTFAWLSENDLSFFEKNNRTFGTRSIMEDRNGDFWFTVSRFRYDVNPAGGAVLHSAGGMAYTKSAGLPHFDAETEQDYTFIISMARDQAGDLWMATYGAGVWKYDGTTLTRYPVTVDGKPITVFTIFCDRTGGLWLGTHAHGAMRFKGTSFEPFAFSP